MKFKYSHKTQSGFSTAWFDTDVVWQAVLIEKEEGNVLVLRTTLEVEETISQVPVYTNKGQVKEYRPTKVLQHPVIELTDVDDINRFIAFYESQ